VRWIVGGGGGFFCHCEVVVVCEMQLRMGFEFGFGFGFGPVTSPPSGRMGARAIMSFIYHSTLITK
jgi:hypothetical protein